MANGNGVGTVQRQLINIFVIIAAVFGAWLAIETRTSTQVNAAEVRLEKRLDKMEVQIDELHKLLIRSKQ